ncbi:MAG: Rieske (2Fe-2S) protein [Anaerolineales bacterium]|jgi:cytochrome b6-f complex iron-sulfur subunit|nr:Rieske (2Fe-2S) protein [Anaerolineales bacterium]
MAEKQTSDTKLNRRDFLKLTWTAFGALAVLEMGGLTLAYMQPRLGEGEFGGEIHAGAAADFPAGSVSHISNGRFYLARLADGGFLALYQRCTHLGCNVPWNQEQGAFICPCHNSQFTTQGEVLNPPAPRPLDTFPIAIRDGQVIVNTGKPIQRSQFDPTQVVYA